MNDEVETPEKAERPLTVEFNGRTLWVTASRYANNGNVALILTNEAGQPYLTATVNLEPLPSDDLVYIKDWSENAGVLTAMRRLLTATGDTQRTGFVHAKLCRITDDRLLAAIAELLPVDRDDPPVEDDPVPAAIAEENPELGIDAGEPGEDDGIELGNVTFGKGFAEGESAPDPEDENPPAA